MSKSALSVYPSLVKLVVFMVVTLVATALLAATIANIRLGDKTDYVAMFTDATGLIDGDDVRIAGVRVGEVTGIEVAAGEGSPGDDAAGEALAEVTFRIDRDRVLTQGATAAIRYRNLIGQRYLALGEGQGSSQPLPAGATIPLDRTASALDLTVLFNGFKPLFAALNPEDVNQLAYEIITVLQGEGGTIESLLASTASLTSELADRDEVIGRTIDQLNEVLTTVADRSEQLDQLILQLQRFTSGLAQDREAIGASLTNISDLAESTAGLVKEVRPPIREDIVQLGALARTLNENSDTVESFLQTWPVKLAAVTRTATYGSWFNFYLCDFRGEVTLPTELLGAGQSDPIPLPSYAVNTARCA